MSEHEPPSNTGADTPRPDDGGPTPPQSEGFSFFPSIPVETPPGGGPAGPPPPTPPPPGPVAAAPRRTVLASRGTGWVVAAVLAAAVVGLSVALATTSSGPGLAAPRPITRTTPAAGPTGAFARGGGQFRFGARGTVGDVTSVGTGTFTISSSTSTTYTVKETSSTTYRSGASTSATASSVKKGDRVIVAGTTAGSTITATSVTVLPAGFGAGGFGGPPST